MKRAAMLCVLAIFLAGWGVPAFAADGELKIAELGQCKLESGKIIENCRIGYRTFGNLNAARDNAVLMPTWLYGRTSELVPLFGDGS